MEKTQSNNLKVGNKLIFTGKQIEKFIITKVTEHFIDTIRLDDNGHCYIERPCLRDERFQLLSDATANNRKLY